nr:unnamed protein product [Digitaria exilis]
MSLCVSWPIIASERERGGDCVHGVDDTAAHAGGDPGLELRGLEESAGAAMHQALEATTEHHCTRMEDSPMNSMSERGYHDMNADASASSNARFTSGSELTTTVDDGSATNEERARTRGAEVAAGGERERTAGMRVGESFLSKPSLGRVGMWWRGEEEPDGRGNDKTAAEEKFGGK